MTTYIVRRPGQPAILETPNMSTAITRAQEHMQSGERIRIIEVKNGHRTRIIPVRLAAQSAVREHAVIR